MENAGEVNNRLLGGALRKATTDLEFAKDFMANPVKYQKEYDLSYDQIEIIKHLSAQTRYGTIGVITPLDGNYY